MIHLATREQSIASRRLSGAGTDQEHWRTDFLVPSTKSISADVFDPQAFLIEMTPGEVIQPHFHEVEQFQVFVQGSGQMGRHHNISKPVVVHYTDQYTGYGPITASPTGFTYFALRPRHDPGAIYLHKPGYRERLRPSKKLHFEIEVALSTDAVLSSRTDPELESLLTDEKHITHDGLSASIMRLGPDQSAMLPDPSGTGGQYLVLVNGAALIDGITTDIWTVGFTAPTEAPANIKAGQSGAEILVLSFRKQ